MNNDQDPLELLFKTDLLSHMGALLNGFIHNINGPLHNMILLVENLSDRQQRMHHLMSLNRQSDSGALLDLSNEQSYRMGQLSEQLSTLVQHASDVRILQEAVNQQVLVDLNVVLRKMVSLCRCDRFAKYQVEFQLNLATDLPLIPIPGNRLVPALMHVFQKMLHALKNAEGKKISVLCSKEQGRICLVLRGLGCKAEPEPDRSDILELFYSSFPGEAIRSENFSKNLEPGLEAVRELLGSYGVHVSSESSGGEILTTLEIPLSV